MTIVTADSAVSEGYRILDRLAVKATKILACEKVAICYFTLEHALVVGGAEGCEALQTGDVFGAFETSRSPDGEDGFTSLWDGEVTICGEAFSNVAMLQIMVRNIGHLGYLISGDRRGSPSAEDVTLGLTTAQQVASVVIEHFRRDLLNW